MQQQRFEMTTLVSAASVIYLTLLHAKNNENWKYYARPSETRHPRTKIENWMKSRKYFSKKTHPIHSCTIYTQFLCMYPEMKITTSRNNKKMNINGEKKLREWRKLFDFKLIFLLLFVVVAVSGCSKNSTLVSGGEESHTASTKCERGTQTEKPNDLLSSKKSLLTYIFFAMLNTKVLVTVVAAFSVCRKKRECTREREKHASMM